MSAAKREPTGRWSGRRGRRGGAFVIIAGTTAVLAALQVVSSSALASFTFSRFAGTDRYDTAALVATGSWTASPVAILSTGENFPDALAGSYLAGLADAPILLTTRTAVPNQTMSALHTLGVTKVVILGGPNAVDPSVETQLQGAGITPSRLSGATRYDTAQAIAEVAKGTPADVGTLFGQPTAIVASGDNAHFPDPLTSSPMAFAKHFPIILTPGASLIPQAQQTLADLGIKQVLLTGGAAAVSSTVEGQLKALGLTVGRFAGVDRTDTAAQIATFELSYLGFKTSHINLANGANFPDALVIGPHAGHEDPAAVLLTLDPNTLGSYTSTWLAQHAGPLATGHIAGGPAAVAPSTQAAAQAIVTSNSSTTTTTGGVTLPTLPITTLTLPGNTTLPTLPVTTLPITLPTLPVTTLPITLPTLPVTLPVPTTICLPAPIGCI